MDEDNETYFYTALYMRLSRDDESYGDSVSIETQRTILRKYAAENNLHVVDEYVDDGWNKFRTTLVQTHDGRRGYR